MDPVPTRACRSSSLTAADAASGSPSKVLALAASRSVGLKTISGGGTTSELLWLAVPCGPLHRGKVTEALSAASEVHSSAGLLKSCPVVAGGVELSYANVPR